MPPAPGKGVHVRELPAPPRIVQPLLEPPLLFFVGHREPVLHQLDAGPDQHSFEVRHRPHEVPVLGIGAEPHHPLDARPVVPGAVVDHDLSGSRKVGHVALEVPLGVFSFGRFGERHDAGGSGIERLGDPLDGAALSGGVTPLEDQDQLVPRVAHPFRHLHQFELEAAELVLVDPPLQLGRANDIGHGGALRFLDVTDDTPPPVGRRRYPGHPPRPGPHPCDGRVRSGRPSNDQGHRNPPVPPGRRRVRN